MGKKRRKSDADAERQEQQTRVAPCLALIARAFDGVPPPDPAHRTLRQAEAWDDYELQDQKHDHKGPWQDLPDDHIRDCPFALPHLDEQGIHYYLPALMSFVLRQSEDKRGMTEDSLLFTLMPSTGALKDYQRGRFALLTPLQRQAILEFLRHAAPEQDPAPWQRVVEAGDDPEWFRKFY